MDYRAPLLAPGENEIFGLSREECGAMIMKARVRVGWIDESSPAQRAKDG
jgi:hypothetical protein